MILALVAAASTVSAQPAASAPPVDTAETEIIVKGQANRQKQVHDFVKALTGITGTDPLARFALGPTCPVAFGLTPKLDAAITARMRQVASSAGIELGEPGCKGNALVLFAPDRKQMVQELRRHHPGLFRDAGEATVQVPDEPGRVMAWHLEARLDRNGVAIPYDSTNGYHVLQSPVTASRVSAAVRPALFGSVVVIDQEAVIGLTSTQVADYAAMRAFARLDPRRVKKSSAPTILMALDAPMGSPVPNSLTQWDLSYLRGLYASEASHSAQRQQAAIARQINRDLEKSAGNPK